MTVSTEQPLTAAELARYLGAECEYEYRIMLSWSPGEVFYETDRHVITTHLLARMAVQDGRHVRNVRPILKRLSSITLEQAREVMNIAGLNPGNGPVRCVPLATGVRVCSERRALDIIQDGTMAAWTTTSGTAFNAVAVVDYLRGQGFDMDGYLDSGKALEQP